MCLGHVLELLFLQVRQPVKVQLNPFALNIEAMLQTVSNTSATVGILSFVRRVIVRDPP